MRTVRKAPSGGVRRGLGAIALAAGVTATVPTFAAHLEIGAGYSWGRVVADGTWRQSGNPYTMHTNDPTWYVGVGGHPRSWLAWHADYVNLGTYGENSWDTTDYARWVQNCTGPNCGWWGQFVGSGRSQGIRVTVGPVFSAGHWHLSLQGGPFFYLSTWSVTIYPSAANGGGQFTASHMNRVQVGDVVGASLRYRAFSLSVDRYVMRAPQDRYPPLIYGATTVTAGWEF